MRARGKKYLSAPASDLLLAKIYQFVCNSLKMRNYDDTKSLIVDTFSDRWDGDWQMSFKEKFS